MAVRFNGNDDNAIYRTGALNANNAYTCSFWYYHVGDMGATIAAMFVVSYSGQYHAFGTYDDLWYVDSGGSSDQSGSGPSTGTWYFITCRYNGSSTIELYVDGTLQASCSAADLGSSADIEFGEAYLLAGGGYPINGRIGHIKLYAADLSAADRANERYLIRPVRDTDLLAFYPTWPGSGERTRDYGGSGYNLSENGTLTDESPAPISWGAPVLCTLPLGEGAPPAEAVPSLLMMLGVG